VQSNELNEPATVFIGPDMETLSVHRDTRHFDRLSEALVWSTDEMPSDRRYGAYIETASGARYDWGRIETLRASVR
jgi:hypothetical protein